MNPQQRIAAIGTDKELSDLLDFSAVRDLSILLHLTFKTTLLKLLSFVMSLTPNTLIMS